MPERTYEILFVADPNLGEPELDALVAQVEGFVTKEGGNVKNVEKWGKKRLAYTVKKHREGHYVLLVVTGGAAIVKEVERRIRVADGIIRHITVRVDEDLRKAETRRAKRQARDAKKKPRTTPKAMPVREEEEVDNETNEDEQEES